MTRKLTKIVVLVLLGALLATLPGLVACGEDEAEGPEIVYGYLWDLTGRAALGVTDKYKGLIDYLRMVEEEDLLPGVKIKAINYDTKSDYGRVVPGYLWLRGKGAVMMSASPPDSELLRDRFEADQISFLGGTSMISLLDCEWYASVCGPMESQIEILMQWIMDTWEGTEKPKIGAIGLRGVPYYEGQLDIVEAWVERYADEFDWLGAQMPPTTAMSFAAEVDKLTDSDFIFTFSSGPPLAAFTREARDRGYQNGFIGANDSYKGFWSLVKASVAPEYLDGIIVADYLPWWDDDVPFISKLKEYTLKYRPDEAEAAFSSTGRINGWAEGMILVDAVRRAVEEVGIENLDGVALKDALFATDMDIEGCGNAWTLTEDINCYAQTARLFEYEAAEDKWVAISGWYRPPSLGG